MLCSSAGRVRQVDRGEVSSFILGYQSGVNLGGDLDSSENSGEKGSVDCRLAAYLGTKSAGSTYSSRRD